MILLILILLFLVCYFDITQRKIPNKIVLIILVLSLINVIFNVQYSGFIIPLLTLLVGFFLSHLKIMGAGDVKLIFVLMLGMEASTCIIFLFNIAFCGFVLAVSYYIYFAIAKRKISTIPYGVAVSAAFCIVAINQGML